MTENEPEQYERNDVVVLIGSIDKFHDDIKDVNLVISQNGHPIDTIKVESKNPGVWQGKYLIPNDAKFGDYSATFEFGFGDLKTIEEVPFKVVRNVNVHATSEKGVREANKIEIENNDLPIDILNTLKHMEKSQTKTESNLFPELGKHPFNILGNWKDDKLTFDLQVEFKDEVRAITFMSLKDPEKKINTFNEAKNSICSCMGLFGNNEGISRLVGSQIITESRSRDWLEFEGTSETDGIFVEFTSGEINIISCNESFAEVELDSERLTGKWNFKVIPNIFEKINSENAMLLWKVGKDVNEKIKSMNSIKKEDLEKFEIKTVNASFEGGVNLQPDSNQFTSIMMAAGIWIDRFGQKILYTDEFITFAFRVLQNMQTEGQILPVDKNHDHFDNGQMTSYELKDSPVKHIVGHGFYNGETMDTRGSSIEAEMEVRVNLEMELLIPTSITLIRNSLVDNPSCTVCLHL